MLFDFGEVTLSDDLLFGGMIWRTALSVDVFQRPTFGFFAQYQDDGDNQQHDQREHHENIAEPAAVADTSNYASPYSTKSLTFAALHPLL